MISRKTANTRNISYDTLRVVAIVFVVMLHILAYPLVTIKNFNSEWWFSNIVISFTRVCVPVFLLLSGAFVVDKSLNEKPRDFYIKRVPRILISLIVWSLINFTYLHYVRGDKNEFMGVFLSGFWKGRGFFYHIYYLYILVDLYLVTPLLKPLIARFSSFAWIAGTFLLVISSFDLVSISTWGKGFGLVGVPGTGTIFISYLGYYLLGYSLNKWKIKINKSFLARVFLFSLLTLAATTYLIGVLKVNVRDVFFTSSYFSPLVIVASISLFLFFRDSKFDLKKSLVEKIENISKASLGIYLVHPLILDFISGRRPGVYLFGLKLPLIVCFPLTFVIIFFAGYLVTKLIRRYLPLISKYIT